MRQIEEALECCRQQPRPRPAEEPKPRRRSTAPEKYEWELANGGTPFAALNGRELAALIAAAARKLEPEREMLPADQLFPPDDARVCVAWEQMAPLVKGTWSGDRDSQLVVERSRKKACPTTGTVYSLTAAGRAMAARIASERSAGAAPPIYRSLHPAHVKEGLLLLVDAREGGEWRWETRPSA